jgi:hypothetical protein
LLAQADDPDSAVRFWAVLGLVALQADDAKVVAALKAATKDESISVGITAADGLFNLATIRGRVTRDHRRASPSHSLRPDSMPSPIDWLPVRQLPGRAAPNNNNNPDHHHRESPTS